MIDSNPYNLIKNGPTIVGIIGKLGSGKSTLSANVVYNNLRLKKKYDKKTNTRLFYYLHTYSKSKIITKIKNYLCNRLYIKKHFDFIFSTDPETVGTIYIDPKKLGTYEPYDNSLYIIEEAGLSFDSRKFKQMTDYQKRFFSYIRHHQSSKVVWISQGPDVDKAIRARTDEIYFLRRINNLFSIINFIPHKLTIDENTHDIVEGYYLQHPFIELLQIITKSIDFSSFPFRGSRLLFRPLYYHLFDSFEDSFQYPSSLHLFAVKSEKPLITTRIKGGSEYE